MLEPCIMEFAPSPSVCVAPLREIISLAAFAGAAASLAQALGVDLPRTPKRTPKRIGKDGVTYLWSGPNAWLAIGEGATLEAELTAAAGPHAAVTNQSDGRVIFRVTSAALLAKLIPIDLREAAFPRDATALTLAGHIGIQLWRDDDGAYELAVFRSYAAALHHALAQADSPGRG